MHRRLRSLPHALGARRPPALSRSERGRPAVPWALARGAARKPSTDQGAFARVVRLENAGIRVTDLARSLRFYTRALGLRVVRQGDTRSWGGGRWVLLQDPSSRRQIELNWYPRTSRFYTPFVAGDALDHLDFSLGVAERSALETVCRRLLRHGGRPTGYRPATTEGWMASVRDPDGIWITIGRRPTRKERRALGRANA